MGNETDKFIRKIIDCFGREQIISCIFNGFMLEYKEKNAHNDRLQIMINMASNIINSRTHIEKSITLCTKSAQIQLDDLPSEVINECASYLKQTDYSNLSIANRTMYS